MPRGMKEGMGLLLWLCLAASVIVQAVVLWTDDTTLLVTSLFLTFFLSVPLWPADKPRR